MDNAISRCAEFPENPRLIDLLNDFPSRLIRSGHLSGMKSPVYIQMPYGLVEKIMPKQKKTQGKPTAGGQSSRHSNLNALPVCRHPFNSQLEFECFTFGHFSAGSQKLDRDAVPSVLGPFPKIVGLQSLLQIIGDPTIQGLVSAPDQIDDPILVWVRNIHSFLQFLASLEKGELLRGDFHLLPSLRIPADIILVGLDIETAQSADLNPVSTCKEMCHPVKKEFYHGCCVLFG